jgi:hypothetical protein
MRWAWLQLGICVPVQVTYHPETMAAQVDEVKGIRMVLDTNNSPQFEYLVKWKVGAPKPMASVCSQCAAVSGWRICSMPALRTELACVPHLQGGEDMTW